MTLTLKKGAWPKKLFPLKIDVSPKKIGLKVMTLTLKKGVWPKKYFL
jgi:hypothetical protein